MENNYSAALQTKIQGSKSLELQSELENLHNRNIVGTCSPEQNKP